jgi:hypothetical protein
VPPDSFWLALGSVGTLLAFAVGFAAFVYEWSTRRNDRRQEEARKVAAWIVGRTPLDKWVVVLANGADVPVYRAVLWIVLLEGTGPTRGEELSARLRDDPSANLPPAMLVVPPGQTTLEVKWEGGGMHSKPGVELAFTDSAGRHWIRRVDGHLESTKTDAVVHYEIPIPGLW